MSALSRSSVWLIAVRYIARPVQTEAPHKIVLGSPEAITNTRVSGAVFLAMALLLAASIASRQRRRDGVLLLAIFSLALTLVRILGLIVDGPGPFTLLVLKPEVAVTVLAWVAYLLERRTRAPSESSISEAQGARAMS
jgi:hypothetical protein